jgi:hypothetical protein
MTVYLRDILFLRLRRFEAALKAAGRWGIWGWMKFPG